METATQDGLQVEPEPQEPQEAFGNGPDPMENYDPAELYVEGSTGQLGFDVGGKAPTTSTLRLQGGKVDIEGQFEKDDRIVLRVELVVREVAFRDDVDSKTGQVVGCARNHKAHVVGIERL